MRESAYPPDWQKRRHATFKRDDWECRGCESVVDDSSDDAPHAHHVVPISEGGGHSLDNLMTLCGGCHHTVHSSGETPPLTPTQTYPCQECERDFVEGESFKGSFCCQECWHTWKTRKMMYHLDHQAHICSTCYGEFPGSETTCPNCNNWQRNEDNSEHLDEFEIDLWNVVREIIYSQHLD